MCDCGLVLNFKNKNILKHITIFMLDSMSASFCVDMIILVFCLLVSHFLKFSLQNSLKFSAKLKKLDLWEWTGEDGERGERSKERVTVLEESKWLADEVETIVNIIKQNDIKLHYYIKTKYIVLIKNADNA